MVLSILLLSEGGWTEGGLDGSDQVIHVGHKVVLAKFLQDTKTFIVSYVNFPQCIKNIWNYLYFNPAYNSHIIQYYLVLKTKFTSFFLNYQLLNAIL